jgi:lycopene cyclase domain-containing protein
MMYATLTLGFLTVVITFLALTTIVVRGRMPWSAMGVTLLATLALTAVFDNVIIGVGLVAYDESLISGLKIGIAPIEDFAYTVSVVVIVSCFSALAKRSIRA